MDDRDILDFDDIIDIGDEAHKILGNILDHMTDQVDKCQVVITFIKDNYEVESDDYISLLDDIDLMVDVNDEDFSLTADIVEIFVRLAAMVREDDEIMYVHKNELLILLTYCLELLSDTADYDFELPIY